MAEVFYLRSPWKSLTLLCNVVNVVNVVNVLTEYHANLINKSECVFVCLFVC
jgi:hypothetical protein